MNINILQTEIENHKKRFGELYNESVETTLPLIMFHHQLFSGILNIQENNYRLSQSEVDVLITTFISSNDNYIITPTRLHQRLLFTTGAITKVLSKLEEKEYITRLNDEYDKRSKLVQLTQKGIDTAKDVFSEMGDYQEKIFNSLSKKELDTFQKLLIKLIRGI